MKNYIKKVLNRLNIVTNGDLLILLTILFSFFILVSCFFATSPLVALKFLLILTILSLVIYFWVFEDIILIYYFIKHLFKK